MTLIKFEPLREMENLSSRLNKYFGDLSNFGLDFGFSFSPRIDIYEDEKHIIVEAEIPGVKKDELKLSLEDNILTINGEKKKEGEEKKDVNFYRSERAYGSFTRSFTLPVDVNPDKVDAKFENGILKINIEKAVTKPASEKVIQIK